MVNDDETVSKEDFDGYLDSIQLPYIKKSYVATGTLSCQEQNVNGLLEDVVSVVEKGGPVAIAQA